MAYKRSRKGKADKERSNKNSKLKYRGGSSSQPQPPAVGIDYANSAQVPIVDGLFGLNPASAVVVPANSVNLSPYYDADSISGDGPGGPYGKDNYGNKVYYTEPGQDAGPIGLYDTNSPPLPPPRGSSPVPVIENTGYSGNNQNEIYALPDNLNLNQITSRHNNNRFTHKPLLFYFMFHNINKYKLLIKKDRGGTHLLAGRYCLETIYNNSKFQAFSADTKPEYTFDNNINKFELLHVEEFNTSDYKKETSTSLLLDHYAENASKRIRNKQQLKDLYKRNIRVFDENYIRLIFYIYKTEKSFFDYLKFNDNSPFSQIIKHYGNNKIDFNSELFIRLAEQNDNSFDYNVNINNSLSANLWHYFHGDLTPIEYYFKLTTNDRHNYLDLLTFLHRTRDNVNKSNDEIFNDNDIGFRLNMKKIIRDNNIKIKFETDPKKIEELVAEKEQKKVEQPLVAERLLLTDEIVSVSDDKNFNFLNGKNSLRFLITCDNPDSETQIKSKILEFNKEIKYKDVNPAEGDEPKYENVKVVESATDIFTKLELSEFKNRLSQKQTKLFETLLRDYSRDTRKNHPLGIEIFRVFTELKNKLTVSELYDILVMITSKEKKSKNKSRILKAHNYIFLEENLHNVIGLGLIDHTLEIYTKNKLSRITDKTNKEVEKEKDFFILDLECEYNENLDSDTSDNCGPMNMSVSKRYFSGDTKKSFNDKVVDLFNFNEAPQIPSSPRPNQKGGEENGFGKRLSRKLTTKRRFGSRALRSLKRKVITLGKKQETQFDEREDKKLYADKHFIVTKAPFSIEKETGIKFEENIIWRDLNDDSKPFTTFRKYLLPPIFDSNYYNCNEKKRKNKDKTDYDNYKCNMDKDKLPSAENKKNKNKDVSMCAKMAHHGSKFEDTLVTEKKRDKKTYLKRKWTGNHRDVEKSDFNRVKKRSTVLSRCFNPAKFGLSKSFIETIITGDSQYYKTRQKMLNDEHSLFYIYYKFWGIKNGFGYFVKDNITQVILSRFDAYYSTKDNITEKQAYMLPLNKFNPGDTISTSLWREKRKQTKNNPKLTDTKRYMRTMNYFREFSDLYYENVLGLELELGNNRKYFNDNRNLFADSRVSFFMDMMEDYLVERNNVMIDFNTRGFMDKSKQPVSVSTPVKGNQEQEQQVPDRRVARPRNDSATANPAAVVSEGEQATNTSGVQGADIVSGQPVANTQPTIAPGEAPGQAPTGEQIVRLIITVNGKESDTTNVDLSNSSQVGKVNLDLQTLFDLINSSKTEEDGSLRISSEDYDKLLAKQLEQDETIKQLRELIEKLMQKDSETVAPAGQIPEPPAPPSAPPAQPYQPGSRRPFGSVAFLEELQNVKLKPVEKETPQPAPDLTDAEMCDRECPFEQSGDCKKKMGDEPYSFICKERQDGKCDEADGFVDCAKLKGN